MIREATSDDLPSIAGLLARRHARVQGAHPILNPAFADPQVVVSALPKPPQGWVADRGGRVTAGLLWRQHDGRAMASVLGTVGDPEDLALIYAVAGEVWLAMGLATHAMVVPSLDRAVSDRLVDLGFGREEAYAVRSLADRGGALPDHAVEVERAGLDRLDAVVRLGDLVARHHEQSPVFDRHSNEFYTGLPESYRHAVVAQDARILLAHRDGEDVGLLLWRPGAPLPLYDARSAEMILLAVHPDSRGAQVGRTLVATAMRDMAAFGHSAAVADWRTTNLEAARFWPSQGFLTVGHRYVRSVPARPDHG